MLKVLHGADFHLDAPFRALPPHKAAQRRAEQRELLGRMAETVRSEGVDLVLLAGDLLDSDQIYGETAQILAQSLEHMKVPVLVAPGNHDFWSARSPYARISWPENVYIFHTAHIEGVKLEKLGCTVLVSSHLLPEIELMADDVGILNRGRLLFEGSMENLRETAAMKGLPSDNLEETFLALVDEDNRKRRPM